MLKIKTNLKIIKKVLLITLALVVVFGAGGYALYRKRPNNQRTVSTIDEDKPRGVNEVNYGPPTEEEIDETKRQKDQIIKDYEESQNPQPSTSITVTISRASQGAAGQPLNVRTIVDGATNGSCEVTLKKSGQATVSKTFPIGVEATYVVCKQADIAASEFGAAGEWTLEIIAKSGNLTSAVASQKVTIIK